MFTDVKKLFKKKKGTKRTEILCSIGQRRLCIQEKIHLLYLSYQNTTRASISPQIGA